MDARSDLIKHEDKLKCYNCTYCGRKLRSSDALKKHIRIHTGDRPYTCNMCEKTFTQSSGMYAHLRRRHPGAPCNSRKESGSLVVPADERGK